MRRLCLQKLGFLSALFASFFFCLLYGLVINPQNASAYTYWQDNPNFTMVRTFQNAQCDFNLKDVDNNTSPLPYKILWANSSGACVPTLFGFTITAIPISSNLYSTYNTIYVDFTLEVPQNRRGNWFETNNFSVRVGTSQNFENGSCAIAQNTYNRAQFHCVVATSANFHPDYAYVEVGYPDITASQLYTGYVGLARETDISLVYLGWGFDATQSPEAGYLEQIAIQNNTIINQNDEIIDILNNQSDNEQEKYEEQSEQVQDDLEDGSAASEQQGQTLIAMLTQFFTAIRDVPADSNCYIFLDLHTYSNSLPNNYPVNLCQPKAKAFLTTNKNRPISNFYSNVSIWNILSTVIFSCIIIGLLLPTLNLIKKTYEELRK